jgi:superfamily II RNA helicase
LLYETHSGKRILDKHVRAFTQLRNPPQLARPRQLPPFDDVLRLLRKFRLLPALIFCKSRADCDKALSLCRMRPQGERHAERNERLRRRLDELAATHPRIAQHRQRWALETKGVGAHHGGQLPAWKLVLETLMSEGLLDAIFATSTVSAGVNFPARSVLLLNSDRYDGSGFVPLTPTEFHQMVGRAGRRGMDRIGFAIVLPGEFMDVPGIARLAAERPTDVRSQVQTSFSMVLNLLLSHTPEQILDLLARSFVTHSASPAEYKRLVRGFERHLQFLKERGYVTADGQPTEVGLWASQLRVDQPLLIAESLRKDVLPRSDPALLAAMIASFVNDRQKDDPNLPWLAARGLPKALERSFVAMQRSTRSLVSHLGRRGFEVRPLYFTPAATMYAWASGRSWESVLQRSGLGEGDLAMLVSRTADNLRHIRALGAVFPKVAATAGEAVDLLMREPVSWQ